MATSGQNAPVIHPLRYIAGTVVSTLLSAAVIGVLTVAVYGTAVSLDLSQFYIASLLGFGLILSQEFGGITEREGAGPDYENLSVPMMVTVFVVGVVLYNVVLFAALFVTTLGLSFAGGQVAYLIAFLYPVYDVKTGSKMNPLSVIGLLAWIGMLLYALGWISGELAQLARDVELEPFRLIENLWYRPSGS